MTAIMVHEHGGPEVYVQTDGEDLRPTEGQILVELSVSGVNFLDVVQRRAALPTPFRAGVEGVGRVTEVGAGVTGFAVGDRVGWMAGGQGSFSDHALVSADKAVLLPDDIDDETAVAALMQGITAHYLTTDTFPVSAGGVVIIHAAAGGLGQTLTQIAALKGATVIGTTSTEEKAEIARINGAAHVFGYEDFAERTLEVTDGAGAAVIFDGVGATTFEKDLTAVATRGTIVIVGNASGPVPPVDPNTLNTSGSLFLTRPTVADHVRTPAELHAHTDEIFAWIRRGELRMNIGARYPIAEVAEAFAALESRATTGKIILEH
ncbi:MULTISPECIES: quinone oxidoreductase [unclassified Brevibacterium]|uniref:quinone oxidoreductase family protein n=1 Tax=unclassified Brevibacterium TaxID=2614124 RepID=UPI001E5532CE|nr:MULTISPECIES: quinone oxidoreductase [unclassified Brevibacterium]MCD1286907.1 NADPH:quinone reductase [Brevibacterium sp. CCUG 69071]MDK8433855.1 quinone oxidoreductase [Brevibacterium sp. H-BE7]